MRKFNLFHHPVRKVTPLYHEFSEKGTKKTLVITFFVLVTGIRLFWFYKYHSTCFCELENLLITFRSLVVGCCELVEFKQFVIQFECN